MDRRVRIDLAYDGTAYHGWQRQRAGQPTIQGALEDALARLHGGARSPARGAGRTDAGVHARGQVADARASARFPDGELERALSRLLPDAIRPRRVLTVPEEFHARRAAFEKTYRYVLDVSPAGDPFAARFALPWTFPKDDDAIAAALARLPGRRDWSGFAGAACTATDRVRTLREARHVRLRPGLEAFVFTADGFLNHMVRNLVGTLLAIGRGTFGPERIDAILARGDRTLAGATAEPKGLCLLRVAYPDALGGPSGGDAALW